MMSDKMQIRNEVNDFLVFTKENGGDGVDVLLVEDSVKEKETEIAKKLLKRGISVEAIAEDTGLDETTIFAFTLS